MFDIIHWHFILFQEFEKILLQYDKNEDGELSAEEMAKYFQDAMVCWHVFGFKFYKSVWFLVSVV